MEIKPGGKYIGRRVKKVIKHQDVVPQHGSSGNKAMATVRSSSASPANISPASRTGSDINQHHGNKPPPSQSVQPRHGLSTNYNATNRSSAIMNMSLR